MNGQEVMIAKVAPVAANTAAMGNGATCGMVQSDIEILKRAYCYNPCTYRTCQYSTPAWQLHIHSKHAW